MAGGRQNEVTSPKPSSNKTTKTPISKSEKDRRHLNSQNNLRDRQKDLYRQIGELTGNTDDKFCSQPKACTESIIAKLDELILQREALLSTSRSRGMMIADHFRQNIYTSRDIERYKVTHFESTKSKSQSPSNSSAQTASHSDPAPNAYPQTAFQQAHRPNSQSQPPPQLHPHPIIHRSLSDPLGPQPQPQVSFQLNWPDMSQSYLFQLDPSLSQTQPHLGPAEHHSSELHPQPLLQHNPHYALPAQPQSTLYLQQISQSPSQLPSLSQTRPNLPQVETDPSKLQPPNIVACIPLDPSLSDSHSISPSQPQSQPQPTSDTSTGTARPLQSEVNSPPASISAVPTTLSQPTSENQLETESPQKAPADAQIQSQPSDQLEWQSDPMSEYSGWDDPELLEAAYGNSFDLDFESILGGMDADSPSLWT